MDELMMSPEKELAIELQVTLQMSLPKTAEGVLSILKRYGTREVAGGAPYDAEEHDGYPLADLLDSTWKVVCIDQERHWVACNGETGDTLSYCEGDVYARDDLAMPQPVRMGKTVALVNVQPSEGSRRVLERSRHTR